MPMLQLCCNEDMADAFHVRLPFGAKSRVLTNRKSIRFFCIRTRRIRAMSKLACNMQQVINFEPSAQVQQPIDVRATIQRRIKSLNLWLDQKSELYSRICEFTVTRRLVIRINLVSLCLIVAAVAVEQQPLFSTIAIACAAWLVYRLNKSEKEGGKK